jgi:ligand-binding sensor domain-containing protein/signal transduction histidine kinase
MKKIKLLILCLFLFVIPAFCQIDYLQFDKLSNGISTNIVNSIFQDNKGWMWFSTSQGLCQYDGNRLKLYKSNTSEKNSLIGNLVRFIYEDTKGRLWIGTEIGGLNLFDRETDNFTYFPEIKPNKDTVKYSANTIAEDNKGNLWIGTNNGLKKFNPQNGKFTNFLNSASNPNSLSHNGIKKLLIDNDKLWIGTNTGVDVLNLYTNLFTHYQIFAKDFPDKSVYEFFKSKDGRIWIGTYADGLYVYNPVNNSFTHLTPDISSKYANTIRAITQDPQGYIWLGTRNGLFIYDENQNKFIHYLHNEKNPLSLCHNSILSIFRDKEGDIWIGTRGGISYLNQDKQVFRNFGAFPSDNNYLNDYDIYSFWLDKENKIWVGTDFGGINILNSKRNQFSYITGKDEGKGILSSSSIKSMTEDKNGNLWIGTYLGGINVYNKNNGSVIKYQHDAKNSESLINDKIWAITKDHNNNFWFATGRGVDFFDTHKNKFIHPNLTEKQVDWIAEDSEYNIWIGTNPEIIIVKDGGKTVKKFSVNTRSRDFCEDHLNRIWIATDTKGIMQINRKTGNIIKIVTEEQGLTNNSTFSIIEDNQWALWIGTANGLSRYNLESGKIRNFTKDDGIILTHYNYGARYKLPSGELLFGGYNGFVLFDPQKIRENNQLPQVIITNFRINNQPVPINVKGSPLKTYISDTKSIVLNYKQNFLTFDFISLNYSTPGKNRYRYKMEGIDNSWIDVGNKMEAIYTNLEPGNYTFRVIASNDQNQWSENNEASIEIKIIPPFYKTLFFKIFLIIFLIVIVIVLLYLRTKRVKLLNNELERLVFKKTKDLQQVAIQLEESQSEVMAQNEEIEKQNEFLKELNEKISLQNRALETYSNDLEVKVKERTNQLEDALNKAKESDNLKSAILANMSHEIRTPMNSIIGLTSLMLNDDITDDDKMFFTQIIRKNCDTLLHLINGVLDLSSIEAGKLSLNKGQINITSLLKNIHKLYETEKHWLEKDHIDFKLKIPANDMIIYTDAIRIEQIIKNLLHNAFKFTDNGSVELGYATSVNDLIIYVKDTGIGIPLAKQHIIFDSFVKLEENTHKTDGTGVGLGLSICWKLAQILDGKLWVISDVNEGSTFYLSFPINGILTETSNEENYPNNLN